MENMKQGVWVIWIGSLAAMLLGRGWIAVVGNVGFWLTFVAHAVECFMNLEVFRRSGGSMSHHIVQTMIYGLFHWTPLKERLESGEGSAG